MPLSRRERRLLYNITPLRFADGVFLNGFALDSEWYWGVLIGGSTDAHTPIPDA